MLEREVPRTLAVKISRDFGKVRQKVAELTASLLKEPHMDLLNDRLTCSELQHWCNSSKGPRHIQRGIKLSGFRARDGGAAFSQTEILVDSVVSLLSLIHI